MRIAMIGSRGVPAGIGGVEHVVEQLTRELTARGHEVLVYARRWYLQTCPQTPLPKGARVIVTAGAVGKHCDTITHTATAMWDVLGRGVDLVHIFSPGPALLAFAPAAAGRKVVFTVQGPDWEGSKWSRPARWILGGGLGVGMRFAAAVSAVSVNLRDYLSDRYGRDVSYIPNGVRVEGPRAPRIITELGLRADRYGLYVGRIVPGKAVDVLIRSWRQAQAGMPLVIVGNGGHDGSYESTCRMAADGSVIFVGPRFGDALAELYSNAAIVVQPSRREGMSLVLLEAAAHGRCVVARDIPANRQVLGEAMEGFDGDSPEALGQAIMKCLANTALRRQLGADARKRVTERFSWQDIAGEYERVYQCVLRS